MYADGGVYHIEGISKAENEYRVVINLWYIDTPEMNNAPFLFFTLYKNNLPIEWLKLNAREFIYAPRNVQEFVLIDKFTRLFTEEL